MALSERHPRWLGTLVVGVALAMFVIGLTGLPNLTDNEDRLGAYVLDLLHNGQYLVQHDSSGSVASKPPGMMWLSALAALPFGSPNRFSLYLPGALAVAGVGLLLLRAGSRTFGWVAGLVAGLAFVLSPLADRAVQTARYDALFALPVTLTALAAFRAWKTGRGWTWFWAAAAAATMVKGPLGLVLGASGLLAVLWERRAGARPSLRGSHGLGVTLFVAICGGWFCLAYLEAGPSLVQQQVQRELIGHLLESSEGKALARQFWIPVSAAFEMCLPWSLAAPFALWRVLRHPSTEPDERRFERFLLCWFCAGLLLFELAAHKRSRLVMPIEPALALLSGQEIARWLRSWSPDRVLRYAIALVLLGLGGEALYHDVLLRRSSSVQLTLAIQDLAHELRDGVGSEFPLTYVEAPFALQFELDTLRFQVTPERAAALLRGDTPAFVVIGGQEYDRLCAEVGSDAELHELRRIVVEGEEVLHVVSNHPRLEWPSRTVFQNGGLRIEARDVRLLHTRAGKMSFERCEDDASLCIRNEGTEPQTIWLSLDGRGPQRVEQRALAPGEEWCSGSSFSS